MALIIATGSNMGNCLDNLSKAQSELSSKFNFSAASQVYCSAAVDFENQPDFFNQVLEFEIPSFLPSEAMQILLDIETAMGRVREQPRGPRIIDLDIIFWGTQSITTQNLEVPHPRWAERSFVVEPLSELPFYETLKKCFRIPTSFSNSANPHKE